MARIEDQIRKILVKEFSTLEIVGTGFIDSVVVRNKIMARLDPVYRRQFEEDSDRADRWIRRVLALLVLDLMATQNAVMAIILAQQSDFALRPRDVRESAGLTPRYATALFNYRRQIESQNQLRILARQEDSALSPIMRAIHGKRRVIAQQRIESLVSRYRGRLLRSRFNMLGGTLGHQLLIQSQLIGWLDQQDSGELDVTARKKWVVTKDELLCPKCAPIPSLPNNIVPLDMPFDSPVGPVLAPPDPHPSCRCELELVFPNSAGEYPPPDPVFPAFAGGSRPKYGLKPKIP